MWVMYKLADGIRNMDKKIGLHTGPEDHHGGCRGAMLRQTVPVPGIVTVTIN